MEKKKSEGGGQRRRQEEENTEGFKQINNKDTNFLALIHFLYC